MVIPSNKLITISQTVYYYANTTTNKTIISRSNNAGTGVDANVSLWRKTPEAINQIRIYQANNVATLSTFKLYGIQAGNA